MAASPSPVATSQDWITGWLAQIELDRSWLPFAVAWGLTAWFPIGVWALNPIWPPILAQSRVDSLLDDVLPAILCGLLYAWPWVAVLRPQGAVVLGVFRAMGTAMVVAVAGAVLAATPQDHWPPYPGPRCQESGAPRLANAQQWCDARSAEDLQTGVLLGLGALVLVGLALASSRWMSAWLEAPLPPKIPPSASQDAQVLAAMALGAASLLVPLGVWVEGMDRWGWPWLTSFVWLVLSTSGIVYGSWLAGQGIGREPARSTAIGLAWLAHLAPLATGVAWFGMEGDGRFCIWLAAGTWVGMLARQAGLLAAPEPDYDGLLDGRVE